MKDFWDRRINMTSRPSITVRDDMVINYAMEKYSLSRGVAMEKMWRGELKYNELLEELRKKVDVSGI